MSNIIASPASIPLAPSRTIQRQCCPNGTSTPSVGVLPPTPRSGSVDTIAFALRTRRRHKARIPKEPASPLCATSRNLPAVGWRAYGPNEIARATEIVALVLRGRHVSRGPHSPVVYGRVLDAIGRPADDPRNVLRLAFSGGRTVDPTTAAPHPVRYFRVPSRPSRNGCRGGPNGYDDAGVGAQECSGGIFLCLDGGDLHRRMG